ncbi:MAG: S24 family peptidase [Acidovorax sp.]
MNKATKMSERPRAGSATADWNAASPTERGRELAMGLSARLTHRLRDVCRGEGGKQVPYLASLTSRTYQSARRWIDPVSPGLPDLATFKSLCLGLDSDPGWLLGLVDDKRSLREAVDAAQPPAKDDGDWVSDVVREVRHQMYGCRARRMRGDEMEPDIGDGDTMFVDTEVSEFRGNGNYLITCDGTELVRALEYRVGVGLVLSCANKRYPESVVKNAAESRERGLKVLGRIEGVVKVRRFWRGTATHSVG